MAYAGFDRAECPPLDMMARLKRETNLEWCGYYLDAPSCARANSGSWRGKRAALVAQGWGLAPIYVGQQTQHSGRGAHTITAVQGRLDGLDAAGEMRLEGFPAGAFVYLDWEDGSNLRDADKDYISAWVDAVRAKGFGAGVYCSYLVARDVRPLRQNLRIWVYHVYSVKPHFVSGKTFPAPDPSTSGYAGAVIWQRDDEARLVAFDNLACDLDVAAMCDPSAPASSVIAPSAPSPAKASPPLPAAIAPALPKPQTSWAGFLASWLFGRPY